MAGNSETRRPLIKDTQHLENLGMGLLRYVLQGIRPGSGLSALLANDLFDVACRADDGLWAVVKPVVTWLYNHTPSVCHGTRGKVTDWAENPDYQQGILGGFEFTADEITRELEECLGLATGVLSLTDPAERVHPDTDERGAYRAEQMLKCLPDPDDIGSSEYRAIYTHLEEVIESAHSDGLDRRSTELLVNGSLEELRGWANKVQEFFDGSYSPVPATAGADG